MRQAVIRTDRALSVQKLVEQAAERSGLRHPVPLGDAAQSHHRAGRKPNVRLEGTAHRIMIPHSSVMLGQARPAGVGSA